MTQDIAYTVVKGSDLSELIDKVQELIDKGWVPQGGIALATKQGAYSKIVYYKYCQAMVHMNEG